MFDLFMPLLGARSLEYANGDDGKSRRKVYDRVFTHGSIRKYIEPFQEERVYAEIRGVLGDQGEVDHTNTLRCAIVVTLAGRFMDDDVTINGYVIPKNVCSREARAGNQEAPKADITLFRFSPDKTKKRGALAFIPFGFAGKRSCPGQKFAYAEATTLVGALIRHFRLRLVPGLNIKPVHGLITHPNEEIYVTIEKR
ncbi:hypothetical protein DPMN_059661 [Dreissena polymorpha]|uniref:Cytochrome P450 n=1 Tax=Dreissena polymorpha TaxID=45954 RepID=A0A9D4HFA1_DREPO|nr:hypothetical protein DPMN_059661 [Dreissena polymorpha]